jgi:hypothetical protein
MTLHQDGTLQVVDAAQAAVVTTFQARPLVAVQDSVAAAPGLDHVEGSARTFPSNSIPEPLFPFGESSMERTFTPSSESEHGAVLLADADALSFVVVRSYETRYVVWQLQLLASAMITPVRKTAFLPLSTSLMQLEPSICSYWGDYLILGSRSELQLWNVGTAALVKRMFAPVR